MQDTRLEVGAMEVRNITMNIGEKTQILDYILNLKEDYVEIDKVAVINNDSVI